MQVQIDVGLAQAFLQVADSVGAGSRRTHELALDLVENAVNESPAVLSGKLFCDVDRLVDADHRWDIVAVKHLVNGQS